jgi:hypothetical protein
MHIGEHEVERFRIKALQTRKRVADAGYGFERQMRSSSA